MRNNVEIVLTVMPKPKKLQRNFSKIYDRNLRIISMKFKEIFALEFWVKRIDRKCLTLYVAGYVGGTVGRYQPIQSRTRRTISGRNASRS